VLGAVWTVLLLTTTPKLFWWFSPVLAGFLLAIPISVWSSRVSLGEWARKLGLFLTPEEANSASHSIDTGSRTGMGRRPSVGESGGRIGARAGRPGGSRRRIFRFSAATMASQRMSCANIIWKDWS
jgi:hypothetical protein